MQRYTNVSNAMQNATMQLQQKLLRNMKNFAFEKGYNQIPVGKAKEVKAKLMKELGINSRPAWLSRLRGDVEPKVSEAEAIERVFAEYKIPKAEIWGT